ncbi:hypothetical protein Sjap_003616 [Stephania japonica]|uniref:Protein preY, mitochondrial n=1 Tax=Stephania japonica TaxID=461633 RepID=A0AAP0KP93_9MAGN
MVRGRAAVLLKQFNEILVCPLSKQPLRLCEESNALISDALGVSYPIVDGIPCLVPTDGKLIETPNEDDGDADAAAASYSKNTDDHERAPVNPGKETLET